VCVAFSHSSLVTLRIRRVSLYFKLLFKAFLSAISL
jgi:hypothetical protein